MQVQGPQLGCLLDTAFATHSVQPPGTVVQQTPATPLSWAGGWTNTPPTCVDMIMGPSLTEGEPGTAPAGWAQAWSHTPQGWGPDLRLQAPGGVLPAGDYAGTMTDAVTGIKYAAYVRPMPDPIIPRDGDTSAETARCTSSAANLILENMTGVSALAARPCKKEMERPWSDALDGAAIPAPLLEAQVSAQTASLAARDTYFTQGRQVPRAMPDTHWDGYIGTTYVLRPTYNPQTAIDYDGGGTALQEFRVNPDFALAAPYYHNRTANGEDMAPLVTVLAQDKVAGAPRPTKDALEMGLGLPAFHTGGVRAEQHVGPDVTHRVGPPVVAMQGSQVVPAMANTPVAKDTGLASAFGALVQLAGGWQDGRPMPAARQGAPRLDAVTARLQGPDYGLDAPAAAAAPAAFDFRQLPGYGPVPVHATPAEYAPTRLQAAAPDSARVLGVHSPPQRIDGTDYGGALAAAPTPAMGESTAYDPRPGGVLHIRPQDTLHTAGGVGAANLAPAAPDGRAVGVASTDTLPAATTWQGPGVGAVPGPAAAFPSDAARPMLAVASTTRPEIDAYTAGLHLSSALPETAAAARAPGPGTQRAGISVGYDATAPGGTTDTARVRFAEPTSTGLRPRTDTGTAANLPGSAPDGVRHGVGVTAVRAEPVVTPFCATTAAPLAALAREASGRLFGGPSAVHVGGGAATGTGNLVPAWGDGRVRGPGGAVQVAAPMLRTPAAPAPPGAASERRVDKLQGFADTTRIPANKTLFYSDGIQAYARFTDTLIAGDRGDRISNDADKSLRHLSLMRETMLAAHPETGPVTRAVYAPPPLTMAAQLQARGGQATSARLAGDAAVFGVAATQALQRLVAPQLAGGVDEPLCDVGYESDY